MFRQQPAYLPNNGNNNFQRGSIFLGFIMLVYFILFYDPASTARQVAESKLDESMHGLDPTKYHGTYPHSLLTLFCPYTLLRDVILDQPVSDTDIPFFWHLHVSDEKIYKRILTECFGKELVELNDLETITQAKDLNIVSKLDPKKHVITSPFIRETAEIFTTDNFGRMIAFYRHPLDYDLHPALPVFESKDSWLCRYLSDVHVEELTFKEMGVAKQVIRQCSLVGTLDKFRQTVIRTAIHLDWPYANGMSNGEGEKCVDDILVDKPEEKFADHTSEAWLAFHEVNLYDCQLYELSQSSWRHQIQTIIPMEVQLSRAEDDDEDE